MGEINSYLRILWKWETEGTKWRTLSITIVSYGLSKTAIVKIDAVAGEAISDQQTTECDSPADKVSTQISWKATLRI